MAEPQVSADLTQTSKLVPVGRLRPREVGRPRVPACLWALRTRGFYAGGLEADKQESAEPGQGLMDKPGVSQPAHPPQLCVGFPVARLPLGPDFPVGPALRTPNLQNRTLKVGFPGKNSAVCWDQVNGWRVGAGSGRRIAISLASALSPGPLACTPDLSWPALHVLTRTHTLSQSLCSRLTEQFVPQSYALSLPGLCRCHLQDSSVWGSDPAPPFCEPCRLLLILYVSSDPFLP